jgi:hypothetical protein
VYLVHGLALPALHCRFDLRLRSNGSSLQDSDRHTISKLLLVPVVSLQVASKSYSFVS